MFIDLFPQVCFCFHTIIQILLVEEISASVGIFLQAQPQKICSQIGFCTFDGTQGVRLDTSSTYFLRVISTINCSSICIYNMYDLEVSTFFLSMGIESVVDEKMEKTSDGLHDATCTACEMLVVWIQKQLRRNKTEDQILNYVNEVN